MFISLVAIFGITYSVYMYISIIDITRRGFVLGVANTKVASLMYLIMLNPKYVLTTHEHPWYFVTYFILTMGLVCIFSFVHITNTYPWLFPSRFLGLGEKIVKMMLPYTILSLYALFALSLSTNL